MKRIESGHRASVLLGVLLLVAAAAVGAQRPPAPYTPPAASCAVIPPNIVRGFVTNNTPGDLAINGVVRFQFPAGSSATGTPVELFVNAVVPTGQTVLVAQTQAPQALSAGTPCVFLIEGAVRPAAP